MLNLVKYLPSVRLTHGLVALASLLLMIVALMLQEIDELHPCPLCISQRIAIIAVGFFAALACLHNPKKIGLKIYVVLQISAAALGAGIAGRHLWIQSLPTKALALS